MSFDGASQQFRENLRLFGSDPRTQTEKFNLYNGLINIAEGLKDLKSAIDKIEQRLQHLENRIK